METRKLGKTGMVVSAIGLGMEHFHPAPQNIAPALRRAIDLGINYVDLMIWTTHDKNVFGAALKGRRDKVLLANHLGAAETKGMYRRSRDVAECDALFHDWLRRLGTDYVDVLLITYVDALNDYRRVLEPGGVMELALRLKREGKARAIGLSGHNAKTTMRAIQDGHMDVVMHPVHIANSHDQERAQLQELCAKEGVGLVAMKPFAGGQLLQGDHPVTPARCLHYTLSQPGISVALMGAKSAAELQANLAYLTATDEEKDFVAALKDFQQGLEGTCTSCNHCQPCPSEIDIATVMRILATADRAGVFSDLREDYAALPAPASDCTECGLCEERCPFGVEVIAKMQKAVRLFVAGV